MKATIDAQGDLTIIPETGMEAYAVKKWADENFNKEPGRSLNMSIDLGSFKEIDYRTMTKHFKESNQLRQVREGIQWIEEGRQDRYYIQDDSIEQDTIDYIQGCKGYKIVKQSDYGFMIEKK